MVNFALATSWENELIDTVNTLNASIPAGRIIELYGSFATSVAGTARLPHQLPQITRLDFENHIKYARSKGIEFNYAMNAPDVGNLFRNKNWRDSMTDFLKYLADVGVFRLTIADPFLIEMVREQFPDMGIIVSVIAGVNTVAAAQRYDHMGVERIVADMYTVNRNFQTLKEMVDNTSCQIELIVNSTCLDHCPKRHDHYKFLGQASRQDTDLGVQYNLQSFWAYCTMQKLVNPIELLKSPFVRPEDVNAYEKIGINCFKLVGRTAPTSFLTLVAKAYMENRYDGNLLDLTGQGLMKEALQATIGDVVNYQFLFEIDNSKLSEFRFIENVQKYRGQELNEYYLDIFDKVVNGFENPEVQMLQKLSREYIQTKTNRFRSC